MNKLFSKIKKWAASFNIYLNEEKYKEEQWTKWFEKNKVDLEKDVVDLDFPKILTYHNWGLYINDKTILTRLTEISDIDITENKNSKEELRSFNVKRVITKKDPFENLETFDCYMSYLYKDIKKGPWKQIKYTFKNIKIAKRIVLSFRSMDSDFLAKESIKFHYDSVERVSENLEDPIILKDPQED